MAEQRGIYLMLTFNNHRELIDHDIGARRAGR